MPALRGIIVPLLTPLTPCGNLDGEGLTRLTRNLVRAGVHGLFVAGTTGEFLALPPAVRIAAFECAVAAAQGDVPVIAGIGAGCLEDVLHYATAAAAAGADAVALIPPPFFPLNESELADFLETVTEQVALPVVLYNIPQFTGSAITVDLAARLARRQPKAIGIKDSSGDRDYFLRLLERCQGPDFSVIVGDESMMAAALLSGAGGAVPSIANLYPELCVAIYDAARRRDEKAALALQQDILALHKRIRTEAGGSWLGMIRWLKDGLRREGICGPSLARLFAAKNGSGDHALAPPHPAASDRG